MVLLTLKTFFIRFKEFFLNNRKDSIEMNIPQLILIYVFGLSSLAACAAIFKFKFAFLLHILQISVPLLGAASLLIKRTKLKTFEWFFISSLFILSLSDGGFYLLMYKMQLNSSDPIIEAITIVPYLIVYLLACIGLWLGVGKRILNFPVYYLLLIIMVPLLLSTPTFYQIVKSGVQFNIPILILQISVLYTLMTLSLFALIASRDRFWNTVALGMFCFGLTDLSIMIEHFLHTVAIESINTYLWTFASLAFATPFIFSTSNTNTEVLPAKQNSIVLQARIWLVSGVTIPVALFSLLGRDYQIMSFTSLTVLLTTVIVYVMTNEFLRQLQFVSSVLGDLSQTTMMPTKLDRIPYELRLGMVNLFIESIRHKNLELEAEQIRREETARVSAQVAHDIRSPLSALNLITGTLESIPEETRLIVRNSVNRINDIANNLLQKSKTKGFLSEVDEHSLLRDVMLSTIVDTMVSEKRTQFREKMNVDIETDLSNSYGLFSPLDPSQLSRAISNIVNYRVNFFQLSYSAA